MEQKKIRIAIIGAGAIADVHIKAYLQYPDLCEVCAVCDLFPEKAEQLIQANGLTAAKAYKDCREAIASRRHRRSVHLPAAADARGNRRGSSAQRLPCHL